MNVKQDAVKQHGTDGSIWPEIAPVEYWEDRYRGADRVWSGHVNRALADVCTALTPGRALDLGCGEGADAIWLAQHGWTVTGIDISPSAVARATAAARAAGLPEQRISFIAADLSTLTDLDRYDLVTASFLHAPVALPRTQILRAAAGHVSPGGCLLITSHASMPPRMHQHEAQEQQEPHEEPHFLTPAEEVAELGLDPAEWTVRIAELRPREVTDPRGEPISIDDSVVLIGRAG